MKLLDKKTTKDLYRLAIFAAVTTLATGLLVITIGNINFEPTKQYKAEFVDATGVNKGDDVRIAGVRVGSVKDIKVVDRTHAMITFTVDADQAIDTGTHASIRYRNLIGQRYLSLTNEIGHGKQLQDGDTIPVSQTSPALDLTVLFNGFKPLFQALSPNDVNTLSYEIIQVFQGEGGTLDSLLTHTASLTSTLADRDQIIDDLIDNLNEVLVHIGKRDKQLSNLIITFKNFVHGLAQDRGPILNSLDQISQLSVQTAGLVHGLKDPFVGDLHELNRFAGNLDKNKADLDRELQIEPIKLNKMAGPTTYGAWTNLYLCGLHGNIVLPGGQSVPLQLKIPADRCNLG